MMSSNEFIRAGEGADRGFVRELWSFLRANKRWWMTPIVLSLLAVGLLILLGGSGLAPFIYTLF
jgi:hypothetical protein